MKIWLDGALRPAGEAAIDPADRGFTLGDGVFETIRLSGGRAAHLGRHLARLRTGAAALEILVPWSDKVLDEGIVSVAQACGVADGVARLTLSRGPAARGLLPPQVGRPTTLITAGREATPADAVRVVLCETTRRNERSPLSRIKSLNYLDGVLAKMEAARRGATDAILLNTRGMVAEASGASVIVLLDGRLVTPPVADGALPGIARAVLLEGGEVVERSLQPETLAGADAMFLVNALGARWVQSLDDRQMGRRDDLLARFTATMRESGSLDPKPVE